MLIREGTAGTYINGIINGFSEDDAIDIDQEATSVQAEDGNIVLDSIFITDVPAGLDTGDATGDTRGSALTTVFAAGANNVNGDEATPVLPSTLTIATTPPAFDPGANEMAITATDPAALDPFFDSVNYVGAVENAADDWFVGWTLIVDQ